MWHPVFTINEASKVVQHGTLNPTHFTSALRTDQYSSTCTFQEHIMYFPHFWGPKWFFMTTQGLEISWENPRTFKDFSGCMEPWFILADLAQLSKRRLVKQQEGQHPLTGQHAANFRLLANQWAKCRLVTQWRHGCRAMRWSVCNAGASNLGRSLCIQTSREWSYPLPIYWYHSKGNWLRYNSAADSFYIMKICSRLYVLYCWNCPKEDKFSFGSLVGQ